MREIFNNTDGKTTDDENDKRFKLRLWRINLIIVVGIVLGSLFWVDFKITAGVLTGGSLSLLNFWWMNVSTVAALTKSAVGEKSSLATAYFFRYAVIGTVVGLFYFFNLISILAALIGLLAFTAAVFIESFYQLYLLTVKKEDIS
jgi:hypothetical protein